jgi:hypothetical protein
VSEPTATVVLQRQPRPRQDVLTTYQVLIDGRVAGGIRRNQRKSFEVPAGNHEIHLEWRQYSSRRLSLNLAPGQEIRLVCRPRPASEWARKMPTSYMILEIEAPDSERPA